MKEFIDEYLSKELVLYLLLIAIVILLILLVMVIIAFIKGREIKLGPITFGKYETNLEKKKRKKSLQEDKVTITWMDAEEKIKEIKEKLISDQYFPTLIIGVGRGGAVVGALLSGCLGSIPIIVIDRIYKWDDTGRKDKMLISDIDLSNYSDKVLIVAGELHTGNTAKLYIEYFKKNGAKEVKMYAFFKEKYPSFQPEYFSIESDVSDTTLPWMITSDYKRQSLKK